MISQLPTLQRKISERAITEEYDINYFLWFMNCHDFWVMGLGLTIICSSDKVKPTLLLSYVLLRLLYKAIHPFFFFFFWNLQSAHSWDQVVTKSKLFICSSVYAGCLIKTELLVLPSCRGLFKNLEKRFHLFFFWIVWFHLVRKRCVPCVLRCLGGENDQLHLF